MPAPYPGISSEEQHCEMKKQTYNEKEKRYRFILHNFLGNNDNMNIPIGPNIAL